MPVIPATREAEAGEWLQPRRQRLWLAGILPLHSSLGNESETPSQKELHSGWAWWEVEVGGPQGQEFKTSLGNMVRPCLYKSSKNLPGVVVQACCPSYLGE